MEKKEQELDLNMLDEVFGLDYNDLPEGREPENNEMEEIEVNYDDPVEILKANIKKANIILDRINEEITKGNFTARMVEVAGNIINGITAASKEIITKENYSGYLEVRKELNDLKEREVVIKERAGMRGPQPTNQQNIIVTNREDLLKLMEGKQPKKIKGQVVKQIPEKTDERK